MHPPYIICRIGADTTATATFLSKANGVLAGLAVADAVFATCDASLRVQWAKRDGDSVSVREEFGTVTGNARAILRAERVALNFMQVCASSCACLPVPALDACAPTTHGACVGWLPERLQPRCCKEATVLACLRNEPIGHQTLCSVRDNSFIDNTSVTSHLDVSARQPLLGNACSDAGIATNY